MTIKGKSECVKWLTERKLLIINKSMSKEKGKNSPDLFQGYLSGYKNILCVALINNIIK